MKLNEQVEARMNIYTKSSQWPMETFLGMGKLVVYLIGTFSVRFTQHIYSEKIKFSGERREVDVITFKIKNLPYETTIK